MNRREKQEFRRKELSRRFQERVVSVASELCRNDPSLKSSQAVRMAQRLVKQDWKEERLMEPKEQSGPVAVSVRIALGMDTPVSNLGLLVVEALGRELSQLRFQCVDFRRTVMKRRNFTSSIVVEYRIKLLFQEEPDYTALQDGIKASLASLAKEVHVSGALVQPERAK